MEVKLVLTDYKIDKIDKILKKTQQRDAIPRHGETASLLNRRNADMEKELCVRCGKETAYDRFITNLRCDAGMSREQGSCVKRVGGNCG